MDIRIDKRTTIINILARLITFYLNQGFQMKKFKHDFIQNYEGFGAFGLNRSTDEETLMYTLQQFSDDDFMKLLIPRLSDAEMENVYLYILDLIKKHLSEDEYHSVYLKDDSHEH